MKPSRSWGSKIGQPQTWGIPKRPGPDLLCGGRPSDLAKAFRDVMGGTPLSLDGLFHGKSQSKMDDDWGSPLF